MKANPGKFGAMLLSRENNIDVTFDIVDVIIKPREFVKLLGVMRDNKLSFQKHLSPLRNKVGRQLTAMSRRSNVLGKEGKMKILISFIISNINIAPLNIISLTRDPVRRWKNG